LLQFDVNPAAHSAVAAGFEVVQPGGASAVLMSLLSTIPAQPAVRLRTPATVPFSHAVAPPGGA
jgi:hypothetical protein